MTGVEVTPLVAGFASLAVALFLLVLGWLVISAVTARLGIDPVTEWGLSLAGLGIFVLAVMMVHIAGRGAVLSHVWLTRGITLGTFAALAALKLRRGHNPDGERPGWRMWLLLGGIAAGALLVWGSPVWRAFPIHFGGDTSMHAAWASQLLDGEATPSAAITGQIPNYYPWMFHATLALAAVFMPNGHAVVALSPLQLALAMGTLLALFALGRSLAGGAAGGAGVALLAGATGGFGYFLSRGPTLLFSPRGHETDFGGDFLFVRSYNPAFYQLAPPFPRDLAFAFLVCALVLAVVGARRASTPVLVLAGAVLGLAGLANAESFIVGLVAFVLFALVPRNVSRVRAAAALLVPAVAVWGVWLVPQLISYARLGGYVNLTEVGPGTLPAWAIVFSWGLITPFAALGAALGVGRARSDPGARLLVLLCLTAGLAIVASTLVPRVLGTAFMSVGRSHRYWPLLGFGLAVYAGLGLGRLTEWAARYRLRGVVWALAIVLAVPSGLLAGIKMVDLYSPQGHIVSAVRGEPGRLVNLVGRHPGRCVVAAPRVIDRRIWTYTGFRSVMYWVSVPHPGNESRIRWAGIYRHITPEAQRVRDNHILTYGDVSPRRWRAVARRYGVDVVVAYKGAADNRGFPSGGVRVEDGPYTVFRLSDCGS